VPAPKVETYEPAAEAEAAPEVVEVEETVVATPTAMVVEEVVAEAPAQPAAEAETPAAEPEEEPAAPPKVIVTSSGARITPVPAPKINRPKK
jgi:hypothetical protein